MNGFRHDIPFAFKWDGAVATLEFIGGKTPPDGPVKCPYEWVEDVADPIHRRMLREPYPDIVASGFRFKPVRFSVNDYAIEYVWEDRFWITWRAYYRARAFYWMLRHKIAKTIEIWSKW